MSGVPLSARYILPGGGRAAAGRSRLRELHDDFDVIGCPLERLLSLAWADAPGHELGVGAADPSGQRLDHHGPEGGVRVGNVLQSH